MDSTNIPGSENPISPTPQRQTIKDLLKHYWVELLSCFNLKDDLESQPDVEQSIRSGVSFKGSQLIILIFAIVIASLGLNTNSVPVVIGAMLISPLMGPIIGMGLGIGIADYTLFKKSFKNITMAVIGSLAASAIYFLISPQYEGSSQLLARTSPSIYDVFVALFGGAAGFVSIACRNKGQVMPGVAIATSLMPPLCTAGYGIATWQGHFFFGALYLFFTNMVFILVATWLGVKLLKYKGVVYQNPERNKRIKILVTSLVCATIGVSCFLTYLMIKKNIFLADAQEFVEQEMVFPNTQVLSHKEFIQGDKRYIDVTLIGQALPKDSLQLAMMSKLDSLGLGGTILTIKQGFSISPSEIVEKDKDLDQVYQIMEQQMSRKDYEVDSLKNILRKQALYDERARELIPEIKVIFPRIKDLALSKILMTSMDNSLTDTINMVFVNCQGGLTKEEREKLEKYISLRLDQNNVTVEINPSRFPWPSQK